MSSLELNELSLALLNAQVNGSTGANVEAALSAVQSRTDEINICGLACNGSCITCTRSQEALQAFYNGPVEVQVMAPAYDEDQAWEERMQAARALDEIEEANRTGMWADQNFDAPDNRVIEEDDIEDDISFSSYDDRQDDYYDDWNTGLDWNEGGYFD